MWTQQITKYYTRRAPEFVQHGNVSEAYKTALRGLAKTLSGELMMGLGDIEETLADLVLQEELSKSEIGQLVKVGFLRADPYPANRHFGNRV